jgi:anti-sigma regulatory factor (Ser/Thr protein kinase)
MGHDGTTSRKPKGVAVSLNGVELARLRLPAEGFSAKIARDLVSAVAGAAGVDDDTAYTAKLATSELVTNATRYAAAGSPVDVQISRQCGLLHIEVEDTSAEPPDFFRNPNKLTENGYGLIVVGDITDECGYRFTPTGKSVWFSLKVTWPMEPAA